MTANCDFRAAPFRLCKASIRPAVSFILGHSAKSSSLRSDSDIWSSRARSLMRFLKARLVSDVHPPTVNQAILADFIAQGFFERHLRRMRTLYRERQEALLSAVQRSLHGLLNVQPADCGMHVVGWLPERVDDRTAAEAARRAGVEVSPLSMFFAEAQKHAGGCFSAMRPLRPKALQRLLSVWRKRSNQSVLPPSQRRQHDRAGCPQSSSRLRDQQQWRLAKAIGLQATPNTFCRTPPWSRSTPAA
jgi:hypothetical protein